MAPTARRRATGTTRKAAPTPAPTTRKRRPAPAQAVAQPARRGKAAPVRKTAKAPDVTRYATAAPTDYHKAFAKWIVTEVGYDPDTARSMRAAFLAGVSIATVSRTHFMNSDYLEQWRLTNGIVKTGPRKADDAPQAKRRRAPEPEPEVEVEDDYDDEDEFNEDDDQGDDEFGDEDTDDESDDEGDEGDEFDDDDTSDEDDYDDADEDEGEEFDDEPEPTPAPKRGRPAGKKPVTKPRTTAAPARKATPTKAATGKRTAPARGAKPPASKAAPVNDDDFLF